MIRDIEPAALFPTDLPVPHAMIGRAEDVARLTTLLGEGVNQLVVGPRRQGKTTVCEAALEGAKAAGLYVVRADLFAVPGLVRLADLLVDGVVQNRSLLRRAGRGLAKGSKAATAALSVAASARMRAELGADFEILFDPDRLKKADPLGYFQHALRLLERIAEIDDVRVVLFVDEFQELGASRAVFGEPDQVMQLMRGELQRAPRVTSLFAGSHEHLMRDLFGAEHRAFFKWGAWFEVGEIPAETWRRGLAERIGPTGVHFTQLALERLIELGELQARTTMLLAQQSYLAAKLEGHQEIDVAGVELGFDLAVRADALAHEVIVGRVRHGGRHALDVLLRIASGQPPYAAGRPAEVKRALDLLVDDGLVERRQPEHRGGWVVVDPILRHYLRRLDA